MKPCRGDDAGRGRASCQANGSGEGGRPRQPVSQFTGTVGVFDSGLGGLTVVRALREHLSDVDFIYLGDTARVPYGTKHSATVVRYAESCAARLVDAGVSHLVVACNTASAWALSALEAQLSIPVTGVLESSARAAAEAHDEGAIIVLATPGTVRSGAYARRIAQLRPETEVISVAAPLLVGLAEEGWVEGPIVEAVVERYLEPMRDRRAATLVLGCTHFPLFSQTIAKCAMRLQAGAPVRLVSSGAALCAEVVAACRPERSVFAQGTAVKPSSSDPLPERRSLAPSASRRGVLDVWLTDDPEHVRHVVDSFLGPQGPVRHIAHVELADVRPLVKRSDTGLARSRRTATAPSLKAFG